MYRCLADAGQFRAAERSRPLRGYRGCLRTLRPVPCPPKIGEVTSWLLRLAGDLDPSDQPGATALGAHCAQRDRLAGLKPSKGRCRAGPDSTCFRASPVTLGKKITEF